MRTSKKRRGVLVVALCVASIIQQLACGGGDPSRASSPRADASTDDGDSPGGDAAQADDVQDGGAGQDAAECISHFEASTACAQPTPVSACSNGFCRIPAGCFVIGSPECEPERGAYSEDEAQVTLTRAFELAQLETSQAEWTAVGFQNPSRVETFGTGDCLDPDCPVGHTTWFEAVAYANRKSELAGLAPCYTLASCTGAPGTGMGCDSITLNAPSVYECAGYRLPTEAEWEYAARAGTRTAFYTGPVRAPAPTHENPCPLDPNLESIAWYCHNSGGFTHKRGQLNPNAWGLYDTIGNEEEWVHDRFNGLGYGVGPFVDPHGGLEIDGTQYVRVTRGGIFIDGPTALRVANRAFSYIPTTVGPGLRLARTLFDPMK